MTTLFSDPGAEAKKQAKYDRAQEQYRQDTINQGTSNINNTFDTQFTPDFFAGRRQAYLDYAHPQLDAQYNDAKQQLVYALARSGSLDSSARAAQEAKLQQTYDAGKQQIASAGLDYENQARSSIEDARSGLISSVNSTGNAVQATNDAIARAGALSQQKPYSPIGQLFSAFTSGLATQADAEKSTGTYGGYTPSNTVYQRPYNSGLFSKVTSVKNSG